MLEDDEDRFREGLEKLQSHSGDITSHADYLAGLLNDIEFEINVLRSDFSLPNHAVSALALTRDEALLISGVIMESERNNGKRLYGLQQTVNALRANNLIDAGYIDNETGEWFALSVDAISRALYHYRLHPNQLDRVWSFELTDHTSGWIYAEYRFGGETAQNFTDVLINAMQERSGADVLHGVPRILYTDPGCALVSATMRNLCKTLGIQLIAHKARNARATGSVEKARDILECSFESGLRFVQVDNIDELNRLVGLWRKKYNRTALHRRTGMTRTDSWLRITPQQLIKAPPVDVCRELAVSLPENRKVNKYLRVSFGGKEYDVRSVPGVCNNDWIQIVRNPWRDSEAQVVMMNEDGMEVFYRIPEVAKDEYGFALNGPTLGESFKALPHTPAQHHLAEVEQAMYGTTCPTETAAAQKAKALPLGGRFNPYLDNERDNPPIYLPKQGQVSTVCAPRFEERVNPVVVVQRLRARFQAAGKSWRSEFYTTLTQRFPEGIP
ncbi:hypothetical protein CE195_11950, partial [Sodalis-like symbiont of Philaenus spumarius]